MLVPLQTPLIRLGNLFPRRQVYAKCEFVAPSGCFKIRGATHLLEHLKREGRTPPLIVPSMGNTALGAAVGAKAFGFTMVGVVPQTIARAKDEKLQALGVELIKIAGGVNVAKTNTPLTSEQVIAEQPEMIICSPSLEPKIRNMPAWAGTVPARPSAWSSSCWRSRTGSG